MPLMRTHALPSSLLPWRRFQLLSWPLDILEHRNHARQTALPLGRRANSTRYPSRAMRYWWAASAISEIARGLPDPPVIVDAGCERGMLKQMAPPIQGSHWIGLDLHLQRKSLAAAGYAELHGCDLGKRIPLADASVDIAVSLHVLEHIPAPGNTLGELARILRPGGILLIGTPIHPHLLSPIRQWTFREEFKSGRRKPGSHVQAFSPRGLRKLVREAGFEVVFMTGLRFVRRSGSNLENSRLFVRLNHLWGGIFPSLGREIAVMLHKNGAQAKAGSAR